MILVLSRSCLCPIDWSQVFSRELRCSWRSADRWCSNCIWVIMNVIATKVCFILEVWRSLRITNREICWLMMMTKKHHQCLAGDLPRSMTIFSHFIKQKLQWAGKIQIQDLFCLYMLYRYVSDVSRSSVSEWCAASQCQWTGCDGD